MHSSHRLALIVTTGLLMASLALTSTVSAASPAASRVRNVDGATTQRSLQVAVDPASSGSGLLPVRVPAALRDRFETVALVASSRGLDGTRIVAVGNHHRYPGGVRGEAWASTDGRRWERTHRLPWATELWAALAAADGSIVGFGLTGPRWSRLAAWHLSPGGHVSRPVPIETDPDVDVAPLVAGDPATGMLAVFERFSEAKGPAVLRHAPGRDWTAVELTDAEGVTPRAVLATASGFVIIGDDGESMYAWRSQDGAAWTPPEELPGAFHDEVHYVFRGAVYDQRRDLLLVFGFPDRVWLSAAGDPFEQVGPLAVPLTEPDPGGRYGWGSNVGVALADGFLVATGGWVGGDGPEGLRLQTSPDGRVWTAAPRLPGYRRSWVHGFVVVGGLVIGVGRGPDSLVILAGDATIASYTPDAPEEPVPGSRTPPMGQASAQLEGGRPRTPRQVPAVRRPDTRR